MSENDRAAEKLGVKVGRRDVHGARREHVVLLGLFHGKTHVPPQDSRHLAGVMRVDVLNHDDWQREIGWQAAEHGR